MRRRRLRHPVVRLGLHRVNEIGKLDRVLDEEHRDVVADEIPVAFVGIELDREAAGVARRVLRSALASDGRETHEHRRPLSCILERRRARVTRQWLITLEESVRAGASRVNDPLGNPLVIEVRDLLAQDEIFEQRRSAQPCLQRALIVADGNALVGRQHLPAAVGANARQWRVRRIGAGDGRRAGLGRRLGLARGARAQCRIRKINRFARLRRERVIASVLERFQWIRRHRRSDPVHGLSLQRLDVCSGDHAAGRVAPGRRTRRRFFGGAGYRGA